jgi:hypothetical protein
LEFYKFIEKRKKKKEKRKKKKETTCSNFSEGLRFKRRKIVP